MILEWIYKKLLNKRDKERHNMIKLQWEMAELEKKINQAKREHQKQ